jgi:hypothetical protein
LNAATGDTNLPSGVYFITPNILKIFATEDPNLIEGEVSAHQLKLVLTLSKDGLDPVTATRTIDIGFSTNRCYTSSQIEITTDQIINNITTDFIVTNLKRTEPKTLSWVASVSNIYEECG